MCGIYGIVNANSDTPVDKSIIQKMSELLKHRGPDDFGFYIHKNIGLGNNRLNIIDIEGGHQPIFNEDKSVCLVYNGEIYNYKHLREELIKKGHVFATHTDTEVIVHAYEEWNEKCVEKFRGMFAFVLWDNVNKKLFMARDRMGIKPFYYIKTDDYFAFASEIKAFKALEDNGFSFQLNEEMGESFLKYSFIPESERCWIRGVKKLLPGHIMALQNNELHFKRYWSLEVQQEYKNLSYSEAVEMLEAQLQDSVKAELVADVPVGILLSGGIDSSSVAALAQKVSSESIMTFTVGLNHKLDERKHAKLVAQHLDAQYHEIKIDYMDILKRFDDMVYYLDDLSSPDPGFFTTYLISKKVKEIGIKVVLVGEGADEIFGGYQRFSLPLFPFNVMPFYINAMAYDCLLKGRLFPIPGLNDFKDIQSMHKIMKPIYSNHKDMFRCISNYELSHKLPNHFLRKVDLGTMANSLEARVPFLDYKLVEFVYSLPTNLKLSGKIYTHNFQIYETKKILREAVAKYLPPAILERKKFGFSLPIPDILKSGEQMVKDYILDEKSSARILFSRRELENLFKIQSNRFIEAKRHFLLWKMFLFSAWHRVYFR